MRKLRKGLSKFLATALSVALMAQPAMTAFADELVPKAVTEMMESTVEIPGDAAAMSLLPLEREYAYLYLNDYTEEELESISMSDILDRLVDNSGNPIEIDENATIVWTTYPKAEGGIDYEEHTFVDRDETLNLNFDRNYV